MQEDFPSQKRALFQNCNSAVMKDDDLSSISAFTGMYILARALGVGEKKREVL